MGTYENNEYEDTDVYDISVCVLVYRPDYEKLFIKFTKENSKNK